MNDVITGVDQLTAKRLTKILEKTDLFRQRYDVSIQDVHCTRQTTTWFAEISFLEIIYSGKNPSSAPSRLFLKLSKPNLKPVDWVYCRKEVEFYNDVAKVMDNPPLAQCYDAIYDPETKRSHILLNDLSETHSQPQFPLPPSKLECELAMDCLASVHAYWWEHPRLETDLVNLSSGEVQNKEFLGMHHSLDETDKIFNEFVDFLGDRLSISRRKTYEKVFSSWPFTRTMERLSKRQYFTLVHGDAHAWNYLYPRDPQKDRVYLIDWHEWDVGLGTNDLAEMIVLWWYPERRAQLEQGLVRRYHLKLMEHSVKKYSWEQCWDDYRLSAIRIMLYPILMYAEGRSPTFWWPILEKGILAFQDLNCIDLLE